VACVSNVLGIRKCGFRIQDFGADMIPGYRSHDFWGASGGIDIIAHAQRSQIPLKCLQDWRALIERPWRRPN
jgi:hypothetical protein